MVACAFDKFFNWQEGTRQTDAPIINVMEKVDGSLGILYRYQGTYRIATRGSFDSEQATWATNFLQTNYDLTGLPNDYTLLFEIVYPDNRIVVDYGEREDLVLLAIRNRFTGAFLPYETMREVAKQYGFSLPKVHPITDVQTLIDLIHQLDDNDEGYVAEFADGQRFKFKSLAYLKLHKLIHTLSFKTVLKAMQTNDIERILATVPDEFLGEARQWISEIEATIAQVRQEVQTVFEQAPKASRKDFAMWVNQYHKPIASYLFAMLDQHDITPLIYQRHEWDYGDSEEEI
ncbi:MAG: RNA ligase [Chloroflexota bacterium]